MKQGGCFAFLIHLSVLVLVLLDKHDSGLCVVFSFCVDSIWTYPPFQVSKTRSKLNQTKPPHNSVCFAHQCWCLGNRRSGCCGHLTCPAYFQHKGREKLREERREKRQALLWLLARGSTVETTTAALPCFLVVLVGRSMFLFFNKHHFLLLWLGGVLCLPAFALQAPKIV